MHACEGDAVTKLTNEKIPFFNAPIYLQNMTQIGKVDEIFGPINESLFSIKMMEGIVATSYSSGDKFYLDPRKLLPLARFLPQPKTLVGVVDNAFGDLLEIEIMFELCLLESGIMLELCLYYVGDLLECLEKNSRRKRSGTNNSILDSNCVEKVEKVVRIKQKQEEDKAAVRLHSFNPVCRINESAQKSAKTERMMSLRSTSSTQVNTVGLQEHIPVQYPEVVLSVEIYHNVRKGVKTQELLVLGGQSLAALRDNIYCSMDQVMQKAGQHDASGYFLIEDVFYTDLRDPSAIDLTRPILDWFRNSKEEAQKKWEYIINGELQQKQKAIVGEISGSHLPHFKSVEMHNIRFSDLSLRLGAGYLYCHQGGCTHTLVIRDMRLIHPDDVHNQAVYPIVTFQLKLRFQKCSACRIFRATKVTVDDKFTPENPCYFCDLCFSLLHFAEDGSPLYTDFLEYDYNHD